MTSGETPRSKSSDHDPGASDEFVETVVSPFHCLYQDALWFHSQSHLRSARSESEASRLSRAALLLYIDSAAALVHQAAAELGRPELGRLVCDPGRPMPLAEAWRLLPTFCEDGEACYFDPDTPPWPQFEELLGLRETWSYPGAACQRRAYYRSSGNGGTFEPLMPHEVPSGLGVDPKQILLPRTGLPRDPYALRPHHVDTARGVLDAAIHALDRRMGGSLTRESRHRREPIRKLEAAPKERVVTHARNGVGAV